LSRVGSAAQLGQELGPVGQLLLDHGAEHRLVDVPVHLTLVAVSGHDSTPHTMRRFAAAFGAGFREVQVGEEIRVEDR
jgi:hypothetical protein